MTGITSATEEITPTMEDYLEAIFHISKEYKVARAKQIASRMNVAMSSVTGALRHLAQHGLVHYDPYEYITLTKSGMRIAGEVARRHRVLKSFLKKVLSVPEDMAEEADAANRIWLGTNDGLARFDGTSWTKWDIDSGLPVNEIRDIYGAPNGDVWFAAPSGLLCWESGIAPPAPSITISTDRPVYHPGEAMTVALTYENWGPDVEIDIQIACQLPDGSLYYYPGGDYPVPYSSGLLPSGTSAPMVLVLTYPFPESFPVGNYAWLAAFFKMGTFEMIGELSVAPWRFE